MRITLIAFGTRGDVTPLVALGSRLRAAGQGPLTRVAGRLFPRFSFPDPSKQRCSQNYKFDYGAENGETRRYHANPEEGMQNLQCWSPLLRTHFVILIPLTL